jgi:hypothetical protein
MLQLYFISICFIVDLGLFMFFNIIGSLST